MMESAQSNQATPVEAGTVAMVKLYDTILLHVGHAVEAAGKGDFQGQFDAIMKATRIIDGLNRHLDMEQGGQVAVNMREMYQALSRALLRSVGKTDAIGAYDRMLDGLRQTRNAWAEISGQDKA
jgi:flagellar protein FliS